MSENFAAGEGVSENSHPPASTCVHPCERNVNENQQNVNGISTEVNEIAMKSRIEVRKYAVDKAAETAGKGMPMAGIVERAKEIEVYIMEGITLPDVYDEMSAASGIMERTFGAITSHGAV